MHVSLRLGLREQSYLGALVVYGDLVVLVQILTGEERLEGVVDLNKEPAWLQGDLICGGSVCGLHISGAPRYVP